MISMNKIYPEKLKEGDEVMVIAPSRSLGLIGKSVCDIADRRFAELGLKLKFGSHVEETDAFMSSSIESRLYDFHQAFSDKSTKAVITVIGGFNSNQLLSGIDWSLVGKNPKIFCGYSDITALNNAIYRKTGLVNYSGPHYSTFGQKHLFDYTLDYFKRCLMSPSVFQVEPSKEWNDDLWYKDQENRKSIINYGLVAINRGKAQGTILGGNLCTFNLLQGTEYFPDLTDSVLFIEDDDLAKENSLVEFDRNLQSIIDQPGFSGVRGIIMGRFQKGSAVEIDNLIRVVKGKKQLIDIPVIYGADFGHTEPRITFPIGGEVCLEAGEDIKVEIIKH